MAESRSKGRLYLERKYDSIKEELDQTSVAYPKVSQLEVDDLSGVQLGQVLHYLEDEDVIGIYSERRFRADVYDLTVYDPDDLEELAEEELELD